MDTTPKRMIFTSKHGPKTSQNGNDLTRTRTLPFGDTDSKCHDLKVQYKDDRAQLNVLFLANRLQLCTKAPGNVPILHYFAMIFCL